MSVASEVLGFRMELPSVIYLPMSFSDLCCTEATLLLGHQVMQIVSLGACSGLLPSQLGVKIVGQRLSNGCLG